MTSCFKRETSSLLPTLLPSKVHCVVRFIGGRGLGIPAEARVSMKTPATEEDRKIKCSPAHLKHEDISDSLLIFSFGVNTSSCVGKFQRLLNTRF